VEVDDAALTGCGHVFHVACITEYASCAPTANGAKVTCPACRVPLTVDLQPADLSMAKRIKDAASSGEGKGGKAAKGKGGSLIPSKSILSRIDLGKYTSSTKVESLMAGLRLMRDEDAAAAKAWQAAVSGAGETSEPSTTDTGSPQTPPLKNKAIIFSQYTSMIEIVEWRLRKEGFVIAKVRP
jgi:DNA repair protein RAD16